MSSKATPKPDTISIFDHTGCGGEAYPGVVVRKYHRVGACAVTDEPLNACLPPPPHISATSIGSCHCQHFWALHPDLSFMVGHLFAHFQLNSWRRRGGGPSLLDEIAQRHAALVEIRQKDDFSAPVISVFKRPLLLVEC